MWKGWKITKLTNQNKIIKVTIENTKLIFNSYSECDKYFDMWKGYTSSQVIKNQLILDKYKYEI